MEVEGPEVNDDKEETLVGLPENEPTLEGDWEREGEMLSPGEILNPGCGEGGNI